MVRPGVENICRVPTRGYLSSPSTWFQYENCRNPPLANEKQRESELLGKHGSQPPIPKWKETSGHLPSQTKHSTWRELSRPLRLEGTGKPHGIFTRAHAARGIGENTRRSRLRPKKTTFAPTPDVLTPTFKMGTASAPKSQEPQRPAPDTGQRKGIMLPEPGTNIRHNQETFQPNNSTPQRRDPITSTLGSTKAEFRVHTGSTATSPQIP